MTNQWNRLLLCVVLAALTSAWAVAQNSDEKPKGEVRNMTGCLTQTGGNEYLLTAQDGSTWEIHGNSSVDLASKVNHTLEVKGVASHDKMHNMKEDAKDMAKDSGVKKSGTEHGHLEVTNVHSVSDSCQK
jgi:hypothetical protein